MFDYLIKPGEPHTPDARLGETPRAMRSTLLPKREASANKEDRTGSLNLLFVGATAYTQVFWSCNGIVLTDNAIVSTNNAIVSTHNAIVSTHNAIVSTDNAIVSTDNAIEMRTWNIRPLA
ncbi:hypothetical protein [Nostoc sp.]|uniref:hypothetical protein n=1 Tax=Nostoc sp. TaxID=1180 RepID=UPI002FF9C10E